MLLGTEMAAAIVALEALPIDVLGMNCATGPELMRQHVEVLSNQCTRYFSVQPNAGLPVLHEGHTHFPLSAEELGEGACRFCEDVRDQHRGRMLRDDARAYQAGGGGA